MLWSQELSLVREGVLRSEEYRIRKYAIQTEKAVIPNENMDQTGRLNRIQTTGIVMTPAIHIHTRLGLEQWFTGERPWNDYSLNYCTMCNSENLNVRHE
jgi:hypothetical protein